MRLGVGLHRGGILLVLLLLASAGCTPTPSPAAPAPSAAACHALPEPTEIAVDAPRPGELHELFELPDTPSLFAPAPDDAAASAYRAEVTATLGAPPEPHALLVRQGAVMTSAGMPDETANGDLVRTGRAGRLAPPTCIERLLFARQAARFPMLAHATEFGAFVVRGRGQVKLYFSSQDRVGQKIRSEVTGRVAADVASGLVLVAHIHNHPFLVDRVPGDRMWTTKETLNDVAGGLAPSLTDVALYKSFRAELHLEEAWLTNGFDGAHFDGKDIDALKARP